MGKNTAWRKVRWNWGREVPPARGLQTRSHPLSLPGSPCHHLLLVSYFHLCLRLAVLSCCCLNDARGLCFQRFRVLEAFLSNLRLFELILSTCSLLKFSRKASLQSSSRRWIMRPVSCGLYIKPLKCHVKTVCPKDALGCSQSDMMSLNMRLSNCNPRCVFARFGHTNKILLFLFVLAYPHIILEF